MYIEAVLVCVNYSDFLSYTLPQIKNTFDYIVVVTTPDDKKTQQICNFYNIECIKTWAFYENGAKFNKANGINEGLLYLSKRDWVVHIDADIYLPPLTKDILYKKPLDSSKIYGLDRLMCPSYEEWVKYLESPKPIHDNWIFVHLNKFPIASRVVDYNGSGYSPIGYFQLWNPKGSGVYTYPNEHTGADRTDMLFAKQWTRDKKELMPEIVVIHLDSEDATVKNMGKNWNGRKTKLFENSYGKRNIPSIKKIIFSILGISAMIAIIYFAMLYFNLYSLWQI
jgi:hypothetical protein